MELDEATRIARLWAEQNHSRVAEAMTALLARQTQIETRAQQIRGGLKPYARPVEIVDYLMGEQA